MRAKDVGRAGLVGWRETVADKAAPAVAEKAQLDEDTVRSAIGGIFFVLSVIYVFGTVKRVLAN
jgi:hypothetical protein